MSTTYLHPITRYEDLPRVPDREDLPGTTDREPAYSRYEVEFYTGYFTRLVLATVNRPKNGNLTAIQQLQALQVARCLDNLLPHNGKDLAYTAGITAENELFFKREDHRGIHYLLTDDEGTTSYGRVGNSPGDYDSIDEKNILLLVGYFLGSVLPNHNR